jgi:hypothetical protein
MFVDKLEEKQVPTSDIIEYLKYVKRENLLRRERYVSEDEIKKENTPADQLISKKNVKLFDENINVEIKHLKKKLKKSKSDKYKISLSKVQWRGEDTVLYYLLDSLTKKGFLLE